MLKVAADFAHFINPPFELIVSLVAIYAASVTFLIDFELYEAITFALSQFGRCPVSSAWATRSDMLTDWTEPE